MRGAVLVERRNIKANARGVAREVRLWRTDFKYPLVREERWLAREADGTLRQVRQEFSVADHLMVRFPGGMTATAITAWAEVNGFQVRHALKTTPVRLIAVREATLEAADVILSAFRRDFPEADVQQQAQAPTAERDYLVFPTLFPDDTSFPSLWGMHNTGQTGGLTDADIDAPEAWEITTGSREVLVGVIDTGLDRAHPDLTANAWTNPGEIAGNGQDDDGNGFADDVHGWDFFSNDNNPTDEDDHGTHCAGTIGGVGNNRAGVAGVNWQVSLVGIRFLGPGGGTTSDAIECVNYATTLGVDVTSNSWGGGGFSALLQTAIADAGAEDILFVAAAGNDGTNNDSSPHYPSNYTEANVVSVASSTASDARSSFSNYGLVSVDLAAPGSGIYSTIAGAGYASFSGTSMATPHVSGAVALIKSIAPNLTAAEIKDRLLQSVDPASAFAATMVSGGRLNLGRLIEQAAGPRPVVTVTTITEQPGGNGDGIHNPGEALALGFTVRNRGSDPAQNVVATLTGGGTGSRFTITHGAVTVGTLAAGQAVTPATAFTVQSLAGTSTPYAEEFVITLSHGTPTQEVTHRVTLFLHTSSRITGRVTDAGDGTGINGATVTLTGPASVTAVTGAAGEYGVTVTDGTYAVSAAASGFLTSGQSLVTVPPSRTGIDFALGVPRLVLTPPQVMADIYTGDTKEVVVEMANTGSAPLDWSLRLVNGIISVAGASAERVYRLPATTMPGGARDGTGGAALNTTQLREVPALEVALGSLTGVTVGAVSTTWDRSTLLADLRARGATTVTLTLPLSVAALDAVDAVLVDDTIVSFSTNDMTLLRTRVSAGAGVLCEADNSGSMTKINLLLADTGMTAVYEGFRDLSLTDIRPHPITQGVLSLREIAVGATAVLSGKAYALVLEPNGRAHAAVATLGQGTVVFVGNEITNAENYTTGDGRLFANQIVEGLVAKPDWLRAGPTGGTLAPGASAPLTVSLDTAGLTGGTYEATVLFTTNDPDEPEKVLPVTMEVVEVPSLALDKTALDFGVQLEGAVVTRDLVVMNTGTQPLDISAVSLAGADAASFSIPTAAFTVAAGGQFPLTVTFVAAAAVRGHAAELVIASNDPDNAEVRVPLTGTRVLAPDIVVTTPNLLMKLRQGQRGQMTFKIQNKGKGALDWQAALGHRPGTPGSGPAWARVLSVSGRFMPGATGTIHMDFNAGTLPPGDHTTTLYVVSPDPETPEVQRTVTLRVAAAPMLVFTPASVVFPPTFVKGTSRRTVQVTNVGAANLVISSPLIMSSAFVNAQKLPLTILPGQMADLAVDFKPTRAGPLGGFMLYKDNTVAGYSYLSVSGTGVVGPQVLIAPTSLALNLAPGVVTTHAVRVTNKGQAVLDWQAMLEMPASQSWISLSPLAGSLAAGAGAVVTLHVDTRQVAAGSYAARLLLRSNDPVRAEIRVPVTIKVTSAAVLTATPASLQVPDAWVGSPVEMALHLANTGNLPLTVLNVASTSSRFLPDFTGPVVLARGESAVVPVFFVSAEVGDFQGSIIVTTNVIGRPETTIPATARVTQPPTIAVNPAVLDLTLPPGRLVDQELEVVNSGGADLEWTATLRGFTGPPPSAGRVTLAEVLQRLDTLHPTVSILIPNRHDFTEGGSGISIGDGGANMFDTGNVLSTNLNSGLAIPYSDGVITGHIGVGLNGRYFTRKHLGLFVFAGELDGAIQFRITGNLGADGAGFATGTELVHGGYRGYVKQVHGASTPSVNHLIIIQDSPGPVQNFSTNTDHDQHELVGLSGTTRIYYLLFSTADGSLVSEAALGEVMRQFVDNVVNPGVSNWLGLAATAGTSSAGGSAAAVLRLDTRRLDAGDYTAEVRFNSNAYTASQVDVPVRLRVPTGAALTVQPGVLAFPETYVGGQTVLSCLLRNLGNAPLTLTGVASDHPAFSALGVSLPLTILAGEERTVDVSYAPTQPGAHAGRVVFTSNALDVPQTAVAVSGRSLLGPQIAVTPDSLTLTVEPGVPLTQNLTVANTGGVPLVWTATRTASLSGLLSLGTATTSTPPGGSTGLVLTVTTTVTSAPGTFTGSLIFASNDPARPSLSVPVTITIPVRPLLTFSPSSVSFADTFTGATAQVPVTLRNTGNASLTVSSRTSTSTQFDLTGVTMPFTITTGGTRVVKVRFRPDSVGSFVGEISIFSNALGSPVILPVSGAGVPAPSLAVPGGGISATLEAVRISDHPLSIGNPGGALLTWAVAATTSVPWLSLSTAAGSSAPGTTSVVNVRLDASDLGAGTYTATLRVTSNAPGTSTVDVPVTLTVLARELEVLPRTISQSLFPGLTPPPVRLTLTARSGLNPAWMATADVPWITLSQPGGTGSGTLDMVPDGGLPTGTHTGQVSIVTPSLTLVVPVTVRMAGPLNLLALEADRTLPFIYGLHRQTASPFESWLLWINPLTAVIEHGTLVGNNATAFATHPLDDRVYVVVGGGAQVKIVQRQAARQVVGTWNASPAVESIHAGLAGHVVTRGSHLISPNTHVRASQTGVPKSASVFLPESRSVTSHDGTRLYAAYATGTTGGIIRYSVTSSGIQFGSTTGAIFSGVLGPVLVLSGDSARLFYGQVAYNVPALTFSSSPGAEIYAASPSGAVAYSPSAALNASNGSQLFALPFTTTLMAVTPDGARLLLYNAATRSLHSISATTLAVSLPRGTATRPALEATQDGGHTWTRLTPGVDYTVESITPADDPAQETVNLNIPSAADVPWQFRWAQE